MPIAGWNRHHFTEGTRNALTLVYSGSEAMDGAMKLARQYWFEQGQTQRIHFVARRQSRHGTTIGALSMSSNLPRKIPYQSLLIPNISHVSPAFAYHYQDPAESEIAYVTRLAAELEGEFQRLGPSNVIAFVAEPVVGATSGCTPAPKGYFKAMRQVCDRHGILLILDEVMCGVGRTGTFFAFEQEDVVPDIMTIGKGLGGGTPLSLPSSSITRLSKSFATARAASITAIPTRLTPSHVQSPFRYSRS